MNWVFVDKSNINFINYLHTDQLNVLNAELVFHYSSIMNVFFDSFKPEIQVHIYSKGKRFIRNLISYATSVNW